MTDGPTDETIDNEVQRKNELAAAVTRVQRCLAEEFEDVQWDDDGDCISVYDTQSEHTIGVTVSWL